MNLPNLSFFEVTRPMPLTQLPVRTTVVQLRDARVLISPASTLTAQQLREAGAVTDIVAPSLLHTGGMQAAARVHPTAKLWGPEGAPEKLPSLSWHGVLGVDAWPHAPELALVSLAGIPKLREHVFHHPASSSLLVTDLVFNIENPKGLGSWLIFSLFGTYRRFAVSRLFLMNVMDGDAFRASIQKLAALEFSNVIPGHGAPALGDGKQRLLEACRERKLL